MTISKIERFALQTAIAIASLVPITAGAGGVWFGVSFFNLAGSSIGDNHVRYLAGLLFGIGIAFLASIPGIERHSERIRTLGAIVVLGGLIRLGAAIALGNKFAPILLFSFAMELGVTPAICVWQARLANSHLLTQQPPSSMNSF